MFFSPSRHLHDEEDAEQLPESAEYTASNELRKRARPKARNKRDILTPSLLRGFR